MQRKRTLYWSLTALLVIAALTYALSPRPPLVETAKVQRSAMQVTIEEEGITRVRHRYVVSAPVAGYLHRIDKDVGEPVSAGEQMTILEPLPSDVLDPRRRAEAEARVAASRSALLSAEQQVAV
ncbi:MAG: RND transporter, partial [Gammaproteobacteria bacterium]|nr:RND transporter [Gammaproteobacteria bacterium]